MATSKIEWLSNPDGSKGKVWNPITGCSKISPGCDNCYAEKMAKRLAGRYGYPKDKPFDVGTLHPDKVKLPKQWKRPQRIFVNSMGDLFHEHVSMLDLALIFGMMAEAPQHTYLMLTKRPENIKPFMDYFMQLCGQFDWVKQYPHVWWGVTCENQEMADKRIPILLQIPAAVRFVSIEPMLSAVDLAPWLPGACQGCGYIISPDKREGDGHVVTGTERDRRTGDLIPVAELCGPLNTSGLDWIIAGGETGHHARPAHPDWFRSLRDQCKAAGVPFFFKQHGEWLNSYDCGYRLGELDTSKQYRGKRFEDGISVWRVGKKFAGRLLDGVEHNEFPEAVTP